jgi:hypothetical protein
MVTIETLWSPSPRPLQQTEEGNNEMNGTTGIPALRLLCNENESRHTVVVDDDEANNDDERAIPLEKLPSYRNGASTTTAVVFEAKVVEERDLQQEVQERMDSMTIDAMLVVNMSTKNNNEGENNNNDRADSRRKSTVILRTVVAALIILIIVASGTIIIIGTKKNLRPQPFEKTIVTASPTSSFILEYAINMLTPLSGKEALMDESSPQHKALWWMVHEDPANMMMTMMIGNDTQSSSTSSSSSSSSSSSVLMTSIMERYTMALLYFSTDGPNWVLSYDFLSNQSICDWGETIRCSEEGSAVRISIGKR